MSEGPRPGRLPGKLLPRPRHTGSLGQRMMLVAAGWITVLLLGGGLFAANYLVLAGHLRDAGRMRLVITLVFGLIHGFGFASDLLEMRLPTKRLAELLVGFNIGVEIGQLTIVLGLVAVVALLIVGRVYRLDDINPAA